MMPLAATYLVKRDTIVLQKEEALVSDGYFDLLYQGIHHIRVVRVHQGQIDRLERSKAFGLLGDGRRDPIIDVWLGGEVSRGRIERSGLGHCTEVWLYAVLLCRRPFEGDAGQVSQIESILYDSLYSLALQV